MLAGQAGGRCFHLLALCSVGVVMMIILIFLMRKVRLRECTSYLLLHNKRELRGLKQQTFVISMQLLSVRNLDWLSWVVLT